MHSSQLDKLREQLYSWAQPLPRLGRSRRSTKLGDEQRDAQVFLDGNGELFEVLLRGTFPEQRSPLFAQWIIPVQILKETGSASATDSRAWLSQGVGASVRRVQRASQALEDATAQVGRESNAQRPDLSLSRMLADEPARIAGPRSAVSAPKRRSRLAAASGRVRRDTPSRQPTASITRAVISSTVPVPEIFA